MEDLQNILNSNGLSPFGNVSGQKQSLFLIYARVKILQCWFESEDIDWANPF